MAINSEKLYEAAVDALRSACFYYAGNDGDEAEKLYKLVTKDPDLYIRSTAMPDVRPALTIYAMAKDELGKAKGGSAYSAAKRIIKSVPDVRKGLKGVWTDKQGRQCMCSNALAVRLVKHLEGFETVEGMDLDKVFPSDAMIECELPLPTPGELKMNKKKLTSGGSKGKCGYDFGDGLPMVDAAFLKDIMDILPDAKAYATNNPWRGEKRVETSGIIFRSEAGDALLLPVRKMSA